MEVVVVVVVITALYLLLYFLMLTVRSLQTSWKSFLLVSIITLATLILIQTVYHEKYRLGRAEEKKLTEKIQLIQEIRMRKLKTEIDGANKTITVLKEILVSEHKENDKLRKQLNEIIRKTKSLDEGHKTKGDVVIQAKLNKDFSKINSEAGNTDSDTKSQEIIFKVQIISSSTRLAINSPRFKRLKNVWEYKDSGLYKYTVGNQIDLKSASVLQSEFCRKGFVGAFVVAFKNGKRIPVREARELLN
jgi:N-acetylmuramoyl-L-alanine amidase